jgi:aminomethyltransferase
MRQTALIDAHREAGARLVDFHGWEMPVQYRGIVEEVRLVRHHAGIFDLGHMGRLVVTGPDREALVEHVFSANLSKMKLGKAKYGFLLNEQGYPLDDVIVYRDRDAVHVVINAGNRERDDAWVRERLAAKGFRATVRNVSDEQAMIAIQGPESEATMQPLASVDLSSIPYYGFATGKVSGVDTLIARTGYTGEDGFEVFPARAKGREVWDDLLGAGKPFGVAPIGLGARDVLRLEAGMPLYGNEIDLDVDPLEAGLDFGVDLSKEGTVGIPALRARKAKGLTRKMVSMVAHTPRVPRQGCGLYDGDRLLGKVASGTASPTLEKNIATGLVAIDHAKVGTRFEIDIRGQRHPIEVVQGPFYKRPR